MNGTEVKPWMDFKELIEKTGLSRSSIYRLINEGKLTPKKPGGGKLFFNKVQVNGLFADISESTVGSYQLSEGSFQKSDK